MKNQCINPRHKKCTMSSINPSHYMPNHKKWDMSLKNPAQGLF